MSGIDVRTFVRSTFGDNGRRELMYEFELSGVQLAYSGLHNYLEAWVKIGDGSKDISMNDFGDISYNDATGLLNVTNQFKLYQTTGSGWNDASITRTVS